MRLGELCSSNPLRIPHPKIDKLACQAQGVGIFAEGEITLHDAYCTLFTSFCTTCIIFMELAETRLNELAHRIHFATFAAGEITLHDAYRALFIFYTNRGIPLVSRLLFYHTCAFLSSIYPKNHSQLLKSDRNRGIMSV